MSAHAHIDETTVSRLIERQMRTLELIGRQGRPEAGAKKPEVKEFITISRQVGSGGTQVAELVSQRLGWPLFGREVLQQMAGDDEIRRRLYESLDERDLSSMEEALRILVDPTFDKNDFFHRLVETIMTIARAGNAVFLGRAADLILPQKYGLRVRIISGLDRRIDEVARRDGLTREAAHRLIKRVEHEREEFIRHHFRRDWSDVLRHDIAVNLDRLSPAQAADVIVAAQRAFRGETG